MGCLPPINWCRISLGHNPSMVCMVKINTVLYSFNITCNKYHFALRQNNIMTVFRFMNWDDHPLLQWIQPSS